jgi:hypothetical protein
MASDPVENRFETFGPTNVAGDPPSAKPPLTGESMIHLDPVEEKRQH